MADLTPKQQRFVREYLIDLNATQAAIRAGYSEHTAKAIGHENLTKPDVAAAIAEAQGKTAEKLEITAEKVLRDLEAARTAARAAGQHSAEIRACELQGKHVGMFEERLNVRDDRMVAGPLEKVSDSREWLERNRPH